MKGKREKKKKKAAFLSSLLCRCPAATNAQRCCCLPLFPAAAVHPQPQSTAGLLHRSRRCHPSLVAAFFSSQPPLPQPLPSLPLFLPYRCNQP
ncbi:hypothetical protein BHE74_00023066 [Ensete ventricosum]|nr:hypothetical protein BHE74_00023066 [Ensete ventricosum]RZS01927.1 hypothetical protein BHM03_00031878 [Ensete ventricosum]